MSRLPGWLLFAFLACSLIACQQPARDRTGYTQIPGQPPAPHITSIALGPEVLHAGVKRFGINLSGQSFYDSGQMLRNLIFRNPGFEGELWQSILRCKFVTALTCTDQNQYSTWPAGFFDGAHFEVLSGPAKGSTGNVRSTSPASGERGVTLALAFERASAPGLQANDFVLVRAEKPGNAEAGWWSSLQGGASLHTEFNDLSPETPGRQALRIDASAPGQSASLSSYFDSFNGRSFLRLHSMLTLTFRAKSLSSSAPVEVRLERLDTVHGLHSFFFRSVPLSSSWHDYTFQISAQDVPGAVGTIGLTFNVTGSSILLDDVALTAPAATDNPTAFRNEVVQTLRDLRPGVLRYMDNGTDFGSSLENMLAPPFARLRTGSSSRASLQEDIPIGLHEFLTLSKAVGAEPWYALPPVTSPAEAANLIEYLSGAPSTRYGAIRARLGQPEPWSSVFPVIHLELGNEQWNYGSFAGSTLNDPTVYGQRAAQIFASMRAAPAFNSAAYDLILGSWATVPWWSQQETASSNAFDSLAVAPYLFNDINDLSSTESTFGPMFAQPEQIDSRPGGYMAQQRSSTRAHLAVYEVNLGALTGSASITQSELDRTIPSLGAGLAVADHMLLMLRDLGITTQCLFALPEYLNNFAAAGPQRMVPLWGAVVDMGGPTNLRRPQFLAEQLANRAIMPTMLSTHITGPDPTWDQPQSPNDKIQLANAHLLQTFAFTDGTRHSLILLNLSRTRSLPVAFTGSLKPQQTVEEWRLDAPSLESTNEANPTVVNFRRTLTRFDPSAPYTLPPHSLTTLIW